MRRVPWTSRVVACSFAVALLAGAAGLASEFQGSWQQLSPAGARPSPRNSGSADYDESTERLIVFGGNTYGALQNDTWVLSSATGSAPAWHRLEPAGALPTTRQNHASGYNPTSNRLVIHGGWPGYADTWVLTNANGLGGTPQWARLPDAPRDRTSAAVGYDVVTDRLILFGGMDVAGYTTQGYYNDVWVLVSATSTAAGPTAWQQLFPSGPAPAARHASASAYDPGSNRLIVFGGQGPSGAAYAELWVLTHANGLGGVPQWIQLPYTGGPSARAAHRMVYDDTTKRAVVVGGFDPVSRTYINDTWILDNADGSAGTPSWTQVQTTGTLMAGAAFALAQNRSQQKLISALGLDLSGAGYQNEAFVLQVQAVDRAPTASAGADVGVNEGQAGVDLDGSGSFDPDGDTLSFAWEQVNDGSPIVALTGASTSTPSFTAPVVAPGGATLTFTLTVTAGGKSTTDTVSVTVVNINHPPVAEAGPDQAVIEGAPVTLDGSASFDIDNDTFSYTWVQRSGPPAVLSNASSATPTFAAPLSGSGGAPGVVATLEFELVVDDGYPADAPAPGYELGDARDVVVVQLTNVNNPPVADAGSNQTVNENSIVSLNSGASSDPDSDVLSHVWTQTGGPSVTLVGGTTATPTFTSPFVSLGGAQLTFSLAVSDGYGGAASDSVVVNVQNVNDPPLASGARPSTAVLWPPNHQMVSVAIIGVTDPNNDATITVTSVTQDEPTLGLGDGDTAVDAVINADGTVLLRAERSGNGDGRVYRINFTASDAEGSSSGSVTVSVPHNPKRPAVDSGQAYPSPQ